jgi:hypothetical protein
VNRVGRHVVKQVSKLARMRHILLQRLDYLFITANLVAGTLGLVICSQAGIVFLWEVQSALEAKPTFYPKQIILFICLTELFLYRLAGRL